MGIRVRKEGRVVTVFDDGNGNPVPFHGYDSPPQLDFPQVFSSMAQAQAKYPGHVLEAVERNRPSNPEMKVNEEKLEREVAKVLKEDPTAAPKPTPLTRPSDDIVAKFREYCLTIGDEGRILVVGEFLLNAYPNLESQLILATKAGPTQRKQFKLG